MEVEANFIESGDRVSVTASDLNLTVHVGRSANDQLWISIHDKIKRTDMLLIEFEGSSVSKIKLHNQDLITDRNTPPAADQS